MLRFTFARSLSALWLMLSLQVLQVLQVSEAVASTLAVLPVSGLKVDESTQIAAATMTRSLIDEVSSRQDIDHVAVLLEVGEAGAAGAGSAIDVRVEAAAAALPAGVAAALHDFVLAHEQMTLLRVPDAIRLLEQGVAALLHQSSALSDVDVFAQLRAAHLLLAEAYLRRGRSADAAAAFERMIRLEPELQLDASRYPPLFVSEFGRVRETVVRRGRGSLVIKSARPRSEVWIDGREVGEAPLTVSSLVAGSHFVTVRADVDGEARVAAESVHIAADAVATFEADLGGASAKQRLRDALARNRFDVEAAATVRRLAAAAGASHALVLVLEKRGDGYAVAGVVGAVSGNSEWQRTPVAMLDADLLSSEVVAAELIDAAVRGSTGVHGEAFRPSDQAVVLLAEISTAGLASVPLATNGAVHEDRLLAVSAAVSGFAPASGEVAPASIRRMVPVMGGGGGWGGGEGVGALPIAALTGGPSTLLIDPLAVTQLQGAAREPEHAWNKWWFWTAVGVCAAAAAGGTYAYLNFDDVAPGGGRHLQVEWR